MREVMVELRPGYGDGYGIVAVDEAGNVKIVRYHGPSHGPDGKPLSQEWLDAITAPSVALLDRGTRVDPGAIARIIGPIDCDEAVRVRARRWTKNWIDNAFVDAAPVDALREALAHREHGDVYRAMCQLRDHY